MTRFACAVCAIAGVIFATLALVPERYAAVARVLLPRAHGEIGPFVVKAAAFDMSVSGEPGSRVLAIEHWDADPRAAAYEVNAFVRTQLPQEMTVIDEAAVPYRPVGPGKGMRIVYGVLAALSLSMIFLRRKAKPRSDRSLVRHALRFARHGKTVLVEDAGRLVLARDASPEFEILARVAGGSLILARLKRTSVAVPRRSAGNVANS